MAYSTPAREVPARAGRPLDRGAPAGPRRPWRLIDSTLREGEQFAAASFTLDDKIEIAKALDAFGIDYLELTTPVASPASLRACEAIAGLGLRARVVTHVRARPEDARVALGTGVDGIDLLFATSRALRRASHGRSVDEIVERGREVIGMVLDAGLEARFSGEDAFRSDRSDLLRVLRAADAAGAHRVGLADTVGIATPGQVRELVADVRASVGCDLEFHGHDDTGCAVANAFEAVRAGATHVDVSILGIGERNGITSLGGFLARMHALDPEGLASRYDLTMLPELDRMIARMTGVEIPFNQPLTGRFAFHHKAGMHLKAVHADPASYEAIPPEAFGLERTLLIGTRLVGRHALARRAAGLGLELGDAALRAAVAEVKLRADGGDLAPDEVDGVLRAAALAHPAPAAVPEAGRA